MSKEKPRIARLTSIITDLQSKRLVTASNLAEKYDVSVRTIYRDMRTLEQSGVPIVAEEGKGYSILDTYTIPPVMFTEEEANALVTAEHIIKRNKDASLSRNYVKAVTKIRSVLRENQKDYIEYISNRIQVRDNSGVEKTSENLIQLQIALSKKQLVHVHYHSLENEHSQRDVEPFALFTTKGNWVLIALCRTKNAYRYFRLDRITSLSLLTQFFEPHQMTLQQYFDACRKTWATPDTPMT